MIRSTSQRERPGARWRWMAMTGGAMLLAAAACSPTVSPSPTLAPPTTASPDTSAPSGPPSTSPAASPTAAASSSTVADCGPHDLTVTGGPWGGAAGSRGADVTVTAGATACRLPARPVVALADPTGKDLVHSVLPVTADGPVLDAGASRTFSFRVSNWCDATARLPLQAVALVADGAVEIGGLVMTAELLPPCNGPGQPALVETDGWQ